MSSTLTFLTNFSTFLASNNILLDNELIQKFISLENNAETIIDIKKTDTKVKKPRKTKTQPVLNETVSDENVPDEVNETDTKVKKPRKSKTQPVTTESVSQETVVTDVKETDTKVKKSRKSKTQSVATEAISVENIPADSKETDNKVKKPRTKKTKNSSPVTPEELPTTENAEELEVEVIEKNINNKLYLVDNKNTVYDIETNEIIGTYDVTNDSITTP